HHRNLSIWFLMQNIFHKAKEIRTITLNAQYIVLFKNPRDRQQIKVLARQMFDGDAKVMEKAFEMATAEPHGYLLVDLKQDTDELHRLRSKIVPGERLEVFVGKRAFKDAEMVDYSKLLRRFRPLIYKLVDKRIHWTKKRRAIQQTGGWFPILAPILGAIAAGVGQSVIQKYV